MGRIKIGIQGANKDIQAFSKFLHKVEQSITALSLVSESVDYPNRNSTDVRRYLEIEFDSEAMDD
jgi:coproporphyrinogen III oxidase-like Fe-S oxidoreductase